MVGPIGKKYKEALKGSESAQLSFTEGIFPAKGTAIRNVLFAQISYIYIQLVQEAGPLSYLPA